MGEQLRQGDPLTPDAPHKGTSPAPPAYALLPFLQPCALGSVQGPHTCSCRARETRAMGPGPLTQVQVAGGGWAPNAGRPPQPDTAQGTPHRHPPSAQGQLARPAASVPSPRACSPPVPHPTTRNVRNNGERGPHGERDADQKASPTVPRWARTEGPGLTRTSSLLSDTARKEQTAPCNTRPQSPALDEAHEVIRALGLQNCRVDPPQEDSDSDVEVIPAIPGDSAPVEPGPPWGAVCRPSASCGGEETGAGRAGAPGNTRSQLLTMESLLRGGTLPRVPHCAMAWRRAGFGTRRPAPA